MLSTTVTTGQTLCFENSVCKHYCKVISIIKDKLTLRFSLNSHYETNYNDRNLRELLPIEEIHLEDKKEYITFAI